MIKSLLPILIVVFAAVNAIAQTTQITGTVTFGDAGLGFATVAIEGDQLTKGAITEEDGSYAFDNINPGRYIITVTMLGYRTEEETIILKPGEVIVQDFSLKEDLLQLDQVVVTGTRAKVPIYNSPVIVNKITDRTFNTTQSLSISEGLNFSPGLRVETNCQNCGFTQLRMNGLEGAYSQILINSRPVFSALAGVYGLDMIPTNMVERVEVVKGGGSVLYGGNAIAGTVNIITKDPIDNSFEVGYNHSIINGDTPDRTISFNGSIVDNTLSKGISIYGFNRTREPWDANGDGFSEITKLRNTTIGMDAFWNIDKFNKIKFNLNTISEFRRGGNNFDLPPHQTDITEQLDHFILGGSLSYEHFSRDLKHKISLYTSVQSTDRDSYYGGGGRILNPGDTLTQDDILALNAYGTSKDIALVAGAQYTYELGPKANLTIGSEYQYNDVEDEMPGYGRSISQTVGTLGTYAQFQWDPIKKLRLLIGGRFDYVNIDGTYELEGKELVSDQDFAIVVPRLTALYELNSALKARLSYAQGYRTPQAFDEDLHIETVGGAARFIRLDPNLVEERSNSVTGSLTYTRNNGPTQSNIVLEGFYTKLDNPFILSDPVELPSGVSVITKRNGSGASVQGINIEANFAFPSDLIFQLGATLQTATYDEEEVIWEPSNPDDNRESIQTKDILRTPNVYSFATLTYNPIEPLSLSWSSVFTGPMDVPHIIEPDTEFTVIERTPSFFENNIKVSYTFTLENNFGIELLCGVQNIFNAYQDDFDIGPERDAGYIYGPTRPRTYFAGVKLRLN